MGIHSCFGYVGYEDTALKSFIETIERFCNGCHTNDDFDGSCDKCPAGIFVNKCKSYLLSCHESTKLTDKAKLIKKMKTLLKRLPELGPCYLPRDDRHNPKSAFNKLKVLSYELDLYEKCYLDKITSERHREQVFGKKKPKFKSFHLGVKGSLKRKDIYKER